MGLPKQQRALQTRADLLTAARTVFARSGFEHARLEDIAALAGRTRGAFYDHFSDKEDVFFAIFEEDVTRNQRRIVSGLRDIPTLDERVKALAAILADLTTDRQRMLLSLEFKMYAIRHPRRRKRLARLYTAVCQRGLVGEIHELLSEVCGEERAVSTAATAVLFDGIALNRHFAPENFSHADLNSYLESELTGSLHFDLQHG